MQNFKIINEKYLEFLRGYEPRIPYSNYGIDKFKPFFGELMEVNNLVYVTQISSPKERHKTMKNSLDFYKIHSLSKNKLIAVVNLNYMFPVPKDELKNLQYENINNFRQFKSKEEEHNYIALLKLELKIINNLKLEERTEKLYTLKIKYPNNYISKKCLDFKMLEQKSYEWIKSQEG